MKRHTARCFHLAISLILVVAISRDSFARQSDEEKAKGFVEGIASVVYGLAWPTATYESCSFRDFEAVRGGYDVVFRLNGRSGIDDSDLWVDLLFEFREDGLHEPRVLGHNAFWVEPFATTAAIGKAIADALEDRQESPTQYTPQETFRYTPPPVLRSAGACLNNRTDNSVTYSYRWDDAKWSTTTLKAGDTWRHWMPYESGAVVPKFQVAFDNNLDEQVTFAYRTLTLSSELQCATSNNYSFLQGGSTVGLSSDNWIPGFPHAFMAHVIAADTYNTWATEAGYRWYDQNDKTNLYAIGINEGVVGLSVKDQSKVFPTIVSVLPGGPADLAGIQVGMWIVSVDGKTMRGRSSADCVKAIGGMPKTTVRIETGKGRIFVVTRR